MDTFNGTTTSGTPLENCMTATEAYMQAFDAMHWAIGYLKNFCKDLVVVYVPGNHDRLSSFHLVHALSQSIESKNIEWDITYEERRFMYGIIPLMLLNRDKPSKNTPLYMLLNIQRMG